jgi:hypothetical protein
MWKTNWKGREVTGSYNELCELTKGYLSLRFERIT